MNNFIPKASVLGSRQPKVILIDGKEIMAYSTHLDETNKPYVAVARAYGRSHYVCRFCHHEFSSLQDGCCPSCFEKSYRFRETPRKLVRCVSCTKLKQVFEAHFYGICEECYNDRKGAFCAKREGDVDKNDGGFPFGGCRSCGEDRLVNGWGYCEQCYCGVCATHPVRLCTKCEQFGTGNHIKRQSIFAENSTIKEVWQKDMNMAMANADNGYGWSKRYKVIEDICDVCWKAHRRARKQKSTLNTILRGLK